MLFFIAKIVYFAQEFYPFLIVDAVVFLASVAILFKIRKKLSLGIISGILFFCFAFTLTEAYFRFVYDQSDGLGFLKVNRKWHERHVVVNGDFKRDREFKIQKTAGVERICAIGDSITFGYGIENVNDRYTEILAKKLSDGKYPVEIYNLAVSGGNTRDAADTYRKFKFLNCDIILHQYTLNDIRNNEDQAKLFQESSRVSSLVRSITDRSYFLDFLYWRLSQRYTQTFDKLRSIDFRDYESQDKLTRHLAEIHQLSEEIKNDGTKMIVAIFPMFYSLDNNYPGWIHAMIGAHFAKEDVMVVDLLPLAVGKNAKDLSASPFDAHPNEYFHNLAAEALHEPLGRLLKVSSR